MRTLFPVLLGMFVVVGCAEQETAEADAEMDAGAELESTAEMGGAADTGAMAMPRDTGSTDLATWNTDADARLAPDEFDGWLEEKGFYGEWNTDGAEEIAAAELAAGLVGVMDTNGDGSVSESEWSDAGTAWFGEDASYSEWDGNGDGSLSESELVAGIEGGDAWSEWDEDGNGTLGESEFNAAVFEAWDGNDDGYVDETEWSAHHDAWA